MPTRIDDVHFKQFALSLERAIEKYGDLPNETRMERQRVQLEALIRAETEFRQALIQHPWGPSCYRAFVKYICEEKGNILAARPYFRERQQTFTREISKALKERADKTLYQFHFNYQFVHFVMGRCQWPKGSKVATLAREIARARTELVEMNLPLAIARARIFWSRTPKSQLAYMDLIQIAAEGLMSAVDKFVLPEPYSPVFRCVAIGRMLGNFIEQYSETLVHFYPNDKRKIYRANKLMRRVAGEDASVDFEKLADEINKDVEPEHRTNAAEIASLVAAASCVSTDSVGPPNADAEIDTPAVNRFAAEPSCQPDHQVETHDALTKLEAAIQELPLIERKLLRLRGVSL